MGCSDSDEKSNDKGLTSETLIGTWVIKVIDDKEVSSNEMFACRYNNDGSEDYLALVVSDDGLTASFQYTDDSQYRVEDGVIYMLSDIVNLEFPASISDGTLCGEQGDILTYSESVNIQEDVDENQGRTFKGIRVDADYSDDLIGVWSGVVIDGDQSEPYDNIRFEFKADGEYVFYKKESEDTDWVEIDTFNTYAMLGTLLITQWVEDGSDDTYADVWEVVIDGDYMTWRATRDGIDYEVGYDFVRE